MFSSGPSQKIIGNLSGDWRQQWCRGAKENCSSFSGAKATILMRDDARHLNHISTKSKTDLIRIWAQHNYDVCSLIHNQTQITGWWREFSMHVNRSSEYLSNDTTNNHITALTVSISFVDWMVRQGQALCIYTVLMALGSSVPWPWTKREFPQSRCVLSAICSARSLINILRQPDDYLGELNIIEHLCHGMDCYVRGLWD